MVFDYRKQYQEYRLYVDKLIQQAKTPVAKTSLTVVGALLFVSFLAAFALRPTILTVISLIKGIQVEQEVVAAMDKKINLIQTARANLEKISSRLSIIERAIPETVRIEDAAKELEFLAIEKDLKMIQMLQSGFIYVNRQKNQTPDGEPKVSELQLKLEIGGPESAVKSFLEDIEKLDRLMVIQSVSLQSVTEKERQDRPYPVYAILNLRLFTTQSEVEEAPET